MDPQALLYGFSGKENKLGLLGGYRYDPWETWVGGRSASRHPTIPHRWPQTTFNSRDNQEDLPFYTFAPLAGVTAVQMFYSTRFVPRNHGGEPFCSGIIFHYVDGGSKVVGEVRLINDRTSTAGERIVNPKRICLEIPWESSTSQRIHFLTETDIEKGVHPTGTREEIRCTRFPIVKKSICYPMEGVIHWWFTASERMRVEIREEEQVNDSEG